MKKIALYIRVSTEEQAENPEGSLKSQEQRLREYVSRRNESESWGEIKATFIERGKSGKDTNRPELQKMLLGIKSSLFDLVLMTEISRLSRSTRDFCNMFDLFRSHNCQILSLREQFDTTTAAGEMMMHMLMNFAQFERQQTAERVKANSRARAKRGLYNGGISPLGYISDIQNKGRLLIVEEEAKVIRECFKTFFEKGSLAPAVQDLNKRGFSPKKIKVASNKKYVRASYFTTDYLNRVLTNPVYIAKKRIVDEGKKYLVSAQWPPIIDEMIFEKAKKVLKANQYRYKPNEYKKHPYILSGFITCAQCQTSLVGKTAHGRTRKHFYYDHGATLKKGFFTNNPGCKCTKKRVKADELEQTLINRIKQMLTDKKIVEGLLQKAKTSLKSKTFQDDIQNEKNKIKEIEKSLQALVSHLEGLPQGIQAQSIYNRISLLEEQRTKLKENINQLHSSLLTQAEVIEPQQYLEFLSHLVEKLKTSPHELHKGLLKSIIHKIIVHPEQVEVELHVGTYVADTEPPVSPTTSPQGDSLKKNLILGSNTIDNGG